LTATTERNVRPTEPTLETDLRWQRGDGAKAPQPGEALVWCSILRRQPVDWAALEQLLSSRERERAVRFVTDELRHRYVVTQGVARQILSGCIGIPPEAIAYETSEKGKPHLANEGVPTLEFNITHSADLMLMAVVRGEPVGVDVERVRPMDDGLRIAKRFFSEHESSWLNGLSSQEQDLAFFRLWTRKEALLKATGDGITGGLAEAEVVAPDNTFAPTVTFESKASGRTTWHLTELEPARGFIGALAARAKPERLICATW
jgi:4'-phosphopantetheinyl transferase